MKQNLRGRKLWNRAHHCGWAASGTQGRWRALTWSRLGHLQGCWVYHPPIGLTRATYRITRMFNRRGEGLERHLLRPFLVSEALEKAGMLFFTIFFLWFLYLPSRWLSDVLNDYATSFFWRLNQKKYSRVRFCFHDTGLLSFHGEVLFCFDGKFTLMSKYIGLGQPVG